MLLPILHGLNYFFLISKKTNLHVQHAFLSFLAVVGFERLQCSFVRLKRQTSYLHIILMEELSYVLTKDFVSSVHVCFFVHSAHFHLACRLHFLFSHRRYEIFMFFFLRNSSPLFSIIRSSSVSVIHVRVNIRNNVKKGTTFFSLSLSLSKSPGGHAIVLPNKTLSCIWVTITADWVILHWWCLWCGRTGGRAVGRTYSNVTTQEPGLPKFLGCRGYQIFLPLLLRYKRCKDSLTW